jgi:hypothetical protein
LTVVDFSVAENSLKESVYPLFGPEYVFTDFDFVAATTSQIGKGSLGSLPDSWKLWESLVISIGRLGKQKPCNATKMIINSNK